MVARHQCLPAKEEEQEFFQQMCTELQEALQECKHEEQRVGWPILDSETPGALGKVRASLVGEQRRWRGGELVLKSSGAFIGKVKTTEEEGQIGM